MIILDEPLSALDVSVSAQIVNLLLDLQERLGVTYVFVGHDLRLVRHLCHDVAVMYRGKVVERGAGRSTCSAPPAHPYTAALVAASALTSLATTDDGDTKAVARRDQRRLPVPHPLPVARRGVRHGHARAARDRATAAPSAATTR